MSDEQRTIISTIRGRGFIDSNGVFVITEMVDIKEAEPYIEELMRLCGRDWNAYGKRRNEIARLTGVNCRNIDGAVKDRFSERLRDHMAVFDALPSGKYICRVAQCTKPKFGSKTLVVTRMRPVEAVDVDRAELERVDGFQDKVILGCFEDVDQLSKFLDDCGIGLNGSVEDRIKQVGGQRVGVVAERGGIPNAAATLVDSYPAPGAEQTGIK